MQVINDVLFYSDRDIKKLPQDKTLEDFIPKRKIIDTRRIEDYFYEIPHKVVTKEDGIREVMQKFENQPGLNRKNRRAKEQSKRRKSFDLATLQKRILKRRGKYSKSKLLTPRKWIAKLYKGGMDKKDIRKMHNQCRIETKSSLTYSTFSRYVTEMKK